MPPIVRNTIATDERPSRPAMIDPVVHGCHVEIAHGTLVADSELARVDRPEDAQLSRRPRAIAYVAPISSPALPER